MKSDKPALNKKVFISLIPLLARIKMSEENIDMAYKVLCEGDTYERAGSAYGKTRQHVFQIVRRVMGVYESSLSL